MSDISFDYLKRQNEFVERIIIFVYDHLCRWRDNVKWPVDQNEKKLNSDLPKFLTVSAHEAELNINFYPEEPQENKRTIDMAVSYDELDRYNEIITVFECKRLSEKIGKKRKDEYVTGHQEITGGIQRFKIEAHGGAHEIVGMIGYVENSDFAQWHDFINKCIDGLCGKPDEHSLAWYNHEHIATLAHHKEKNKYYGKSIHPRITKPDITIHHLWVNRQKTCLL